MKSREVVDRVNTGHDIQIHDIIFFLCFFRKRRGESDGFVWLRVMAVVIIREREKRWFWNVKKRGGEFGFQSVKSSVITNGFIVF